MFSFCGSSHPFEVVSSIPNEGYLFDDEVNMHITIFATRAPILLLFPKKYFLFAKMVTNAESPIYEYLYYIVNVEWLI